MSGMDPELDNLGAVKRNRWDDLQQYERAVIDQVKEEALKLYQGGHLPECIGTLKARPYLRRYGLSLAHRDLLDEGLASIETIEENLKKFKGKIQDHAGNYIEREKEFLRCCTCPIEIFHRCEILSRFDLDSQK